MQILAIDLGKFKSEAVIFDSETNKHAFTRVSTSPQVIHDLLIEHEPDRLVIEVLRSGPGRGPTLGTGLDVSAVAPSGVDEGG